MNTLCSLALLPVLAGTLVLLAADPGESHSRTLDPASSGFHPAFSGFHPASSGFHPAFSSERAPSTHPRGRSVTMPASKRALLTYLVRQNGTGDATTIQGAIDLYPNGSIESYDVIIGPGTYDEVVVADDNGSYDPDTGIRIKLIAEEGPGSVVLEGELHGPSYWSNLQVFDLTFDGAQIRTGASWTDLFHCEVRNSAGRSAVLVDGMDGTLNAEDCVFENNSTPGDGGAICVTGSGFPDLRIRNSDFFGNSAGGMGGAIYGSDFGYSIAYCTFAENQASSGGAFAADDPVKYWSSSIHPFWASTFWNNVADSLGAHVRERAAGNALWFINNLLVDGIGAEAFHYASGAGVPNILCNDFWNNAGGDWTGPLADSLGTSGNVSLDPRLCDPENGSFDLKPNSSLMPLVPCNSLPIGVSDVFECSPIFQETDVAAGEAAVAGFASRAEPSVASGQGTRIRFTLPAREAVEVSVYTASGMKVRHLYQGARGAGTHTIDWDGTNENGERVASGVYFYRIDAGGTEATGRIVLLK